jgi:hypothetical protein
MMNEFEKINEYLFSMFEDMVVILLYLILNPIVKIVILVWELKIWNIL